MQNDVEVVSDTAFNSSSSKRKLEKQSSDTLSVMSPNNIYNLNKFDETERHPYFDSNQKVLFIGPSEMMPQFSADKIIVVDDFTTSS